MRRFATKLQVLIFTVIAFALPQSVFALTYPKLLPACAVNDGSCNACDIVALFGNWSELLALGVILPGALLIAIGGFTWLISAGNPEKVQLGRKMIVGAIFGMVITFLAYSIVNFSIAALTGQTNLDKVNTGAPGVHLFNTEWDLICKFGSGGSEPLRTCEGAINGATCVVSGQCTGVGCQCSAGVCASGCQVQAGSGASCVTECGAGQTEETADVALCPAGQICCSSGSSSSTSTSSVVTSCSGEAAGTPCNTSTCSDGSYCQCNASEICVDGCDVAHASATLASCVPTTGDCTALGPGATVDSAAGLCPASGNPVCCYAP